MTQEIVAAFGEAFNSHDVDRVIALMTDDVVFESTAPPPDGARYEGQSAVRAVWESLFASTPTAQFAEEETWGSGDRWVFQWRYTWDGGHVRGVDLLTVRDGKIAAKLSYVKG